MTRAKLNRFGGSRGSALALSLRLTGAMAAVACVSMVAPAHADELVQKVGNGQIDWSKRTITATGSAAPNKKAPSVAAARIGAQRAARLDALRAILEVVKGLKVDAKKTGGDLMTNGTIRGQVTGLASSFREVDTKYYSDGSVDVTVEMDLSDELTQALLGPGHKKAAKKQAAARAKLTTPGAKTYTGLVINAKKLGVTPSMAPRVVDESGREVFGVGLVTEVALSKGGIAGFARDVETAKADARVGGKPLIVKALNLAQGTRTDVVLANADAEKLRDAATDKSFLTEGRVIIVVD